MESEKQYISVSELKDRFKRRVKWLEKDVHDPYSQGLFHGAEYDAKLIDEIPVVDAVEVVPGRWKIINTYFGDEATCSVCGFEMCVNEPGNGLRYVWELHYCPNCGAKMDLKEEA